MYSIVLDVHCIRVSKLDLFTQIPIKISDLCPYFVIADNTIMNDSVHMLLCSSAGISIGYF